MKLKVLELDASKAYKIYIERGILDQLGQMLPGGEYRQCLLLMDENIHRLYGAQVEKNIEAGKIKVFPYIIPAGEASKSFELLEDLMEYMAQEAFARTDLLIAFGGGVTGDLGGFAAAIYQRGMDYIQVPTSLLAAIDSSVGGKTAINLSAGKNLVGAFHQPKGVFCDPNLFQSLEEEDFTSGLAEMIKYAVLFDPKLFRRLMEKVDKESADLEELIATCLSYKADLVHEDERDQGTRQLLNLGHTLGHAIERASGYQIKHGQAVAMGMGIMARACAKKGLASVETARSIERALKVNGLKSNSTFSVQELLTHSKLDKKVGREQINLITINAIGACQIRPTTFEELEEFIDLGRRDL